MDKPPLEIAIDLVSTSRIAAACDVSVQAVTKWKAKGRLPRTEWTGETDYASKIELLCAGRITRAQLLSLRDREAA